MVPVLSDGLDSVMSIVMTKILKIANIKITMLLEMIKI